jgi:hypothetical protein
MGIERHVCMVYIDSLVKHMCCNNNNTYFWCFNVLDCFKLNDGSCFCLLCSLSFIAIFLLSLFYYCLVAW